MLTGLVRLPELLNFHCNVRVMKSADEKPLDTSQTRIRNLYDLLMKLRERGEAKSELNFFIHGVLIIQERPFEIYRFMSTILELHLVNAYHTLSEKFPSIEIVNYSNFIRTVISVSRTQFLKRYLNIQRVDVVGVSKKKFKFTKLRSFLSICKHIRSLRISYVNIQQEDLDQLPSLKSLAMLNDLELMHCHKTDLSFLSRWEFLDRLKTNLVNLDRIEILKQLNANGIYEFVIDNENSILVKKHVRENSYDLHLVLSGDVEREAHLGVTFGGLQEILYRANSLFFCKHWLDFDDKTEQKIVSDSIFI